MKALFLVVHAPTDATRRARFPDDEQIVAPVDLVTIPRVPAHAYTSPSRAARETSKALRLDVTVCATLRDLDVASWRGRTIDEVRVADPQGFGSWMSDPGARPHGGESIAALAQRIAAFLDRIRILEGTTIAVTHQAVVRTAVLVALGAPLDAFWRLDAAPSSITELHPHARGWRVARVNAVIR